MMKYRQLEHGEIIQTGDEYDACCDPWRDWPVWRTVHSDTIGQAAPDPRYPAHTIYRRPVEE